MKPSGSILFIFLFATCLVIGQNENAADKKKAVIYFIETSDRPNLKWDKVSTDAVPVYDDHKSIGLILPKFYVRYECDPGEHLFYTDAENSSFVEADVLAGKVYIIEVRIQYASPFRPQAGVFGAQTVIKPVNPNLPEFDYEDYRKVFVKKNADRLTDRRDKRYNSFLKTHKKYDLHDTEEQIRKFNKKKRKGKVGVLHPEWHIESENVLIGKEYLESRESSQEAIIQ